MNIKRSNLILSPQCPHTEWHLAQAHDIWWPLSYDQTLCSDTQQRQCTTPPPPYLLTTSLQPIGTNIYATSLDQMWFTLQKKRIKCQNLDAKICETLNFTLQTSLPIMVPCSQSHCKAPWPAWAGLHGMGIMKHNYCTISRVNWINWTLFTYTQQSFDYIYYFFTHQIYKSVISVLNPIQFRHYIY